MVDVTIPSLLLYYSNLDSIHKAIFVYISGTIPTFLDGEMKSIRILSKLPVRAHNGGLFISRGRGMHAERVIDSFELIFVRQGSLSMHEDGHEFVVSKGQTLILYPGCTHGGTARIRIIYSFTGPLRPGGYFSRRIRSSANCLLGGPTT